MPQSHRLEPVDALDGCGAGNVQLTFHGLQSTAMAERAQHEAKIDVCLVQLRLGEMGSQERQVELAAVERDQQREAGDVGLGTRGG